MKNSTFSAQVATNLLNVLQGYSKTIRLLLVMFLTLTVTTNAWGAEETATLSFASTAQRVSQTTTKQVWSNGGITFTNNKASSTTNVANYSNPVRLYANSEVIVEHTSGKMTKIVFDCNGSYANAMNTSIGTVSGATVSVSSDKVTVTFTPAVASFTVAKLSGQIRLDAITVTYTSGGGSTPDPCTTPTVAWDTKPANGEVGGSMTASVTTNYSNGLTYSSSNQTVATVTNAGVINYLSAGTTTITATVTGDGTTFCEGPVSVQQEITVTAPAGGGDGECSWEETAIGNIEDDDIVVITMTTSNGTTYAMSNDNGTGSAPAATTVTVSGSTLTSDIADNLKWNIINNTGSLTIYPNGTTSTWLYCTGTNNGVRVGTNDDKTFTIDATSGYLKHSNTSRYVGVYTTNPDWRCYTSTTSNIANQTLKFYVYTCDGGGGDEPEPEPDPVDPEVTFSDGEYTVGGAALDLSTLLTTNSTGAVTYSVKTDGGTEATINGTSFTATAAGTCTVQASIANTTYYNAATATANIIVTVPAFVEGTWTLVTDASNLKAGDRIVIAAADSDFALSTTQNTNNRGQAAVTKDGNIIKFTEFTQILTLEAGTVDNTLAFNTGAGYLYAASSGSNHLKTQDTNNDNGSWSISIDNTGVATVVAQGTYTRNTMQYNKQSGLFACYETASQQAIAIYKEAGNTPDPIKLATPENLSVLSVTASSATLTWNEVEHASSYIVNLGGNEHETNTNSLTLNELDPSTTYTWTVKAKGDGINYSDSENSSQSSFTTDAATYTITYVTYGGTKVESTSGTALPNPLPTTTRDHYTFAGWFTDEDCTQAATAGATINANTTLYAKWTPVTYTVTFEAGSGTYTSGDIQGNFETGITLPTATPCDYASNNGWSFVGWSESSVSETTVRPAIHTGNYKPTKNITLHAVYAKTGTAQGGAGEFVLSLQYEGTTYYVGQTFDNSKLSAETNQANAALFTIEDNYLHYEGGYISHVATTSSPNITKQADKANAQAWTITEEANTIIFTSTADNTRGLGFNYNNGSPRFAAYQLSNADYPHTFTKTSVSDAAIDVTTYNSTPSCEAPVDPTWNAATINHSSIQVVCGSKTPLNAADPNGPATITFNGYDLQNSVTVTASQGFLVSTNKTEENTYKQEVTVNPYKDGQNIGKIQNVYVIAQAPAQSGNYDGTITLTGADITNGSQVINVTAAVTCTQYTITWSVNGDDSHQVTYSPGGALQLPEIDITPCDGMDHVGWTDNMGYDHGTDILFTETTDMTVTSDKTYYAVFAASTSSDGGAETILDFTTQGYANQATVTSLTINAVTVTFSNGTNNNNPPKYYTSGTAVRVYGGNTFTVSSGNTISKIVITFGSSDGTNEITTDSGDYSDGTWTGSANEITFTIGGSSGNRRIASIAVTSAGGGASYYTDYTTTCEGRQLETPTNLQATDITYNGATLTWDAVAGANKYEVVINGTEYISNTNSYTTHDLKPQTAYTWTVQAIGNGTTFTDSEISAEATFTTGTALTITWSVSTNTTTTTITKGQPIGANLKTPATPAACEGKYFMGWSATNTVKSDGSDFTPITSDIVPETNVTYYAVFAEPTGNGGAQGELFSESFETIEGSGGNDGKWDGNIASAQLTEHGDWEFTYAYKGYECIKLGKASGQGQATTPALDINGNATLTFNAGAWNGNSENLTINLQIVGEGSIAPSSVTLTKGQFNTYTANITGANADTKVKFSAATASNNRFFLDEVKVSGGSSVSYTDYSTSCGTYTVTFYGFNSGGYTTTCDDNPAEIAVAQGETYQIPDCEPTFDPAGLGRTFAGTWNTQADGKGTTYEPGDEFIVDSDITLYAQWALNTSGNTTLPTDVEDLATTDIIVTGGTTLTLQAGTTTINSLTLKGGLLGEDSKSGYAMPSVVIPDNATLVRKNTTINLDLVVNSDSWYPFAVPFAVANNNNIDYLDPVLKAASTYNTHFAIKTYDGENRAKVGTDQENNWDKVLQTAGLQPGKGYIISALTYPDKDTATIRIPMTVPNEWLTNGEQTTVNEVTRNQVTVFAHAGAAATEHQRHAGWNFVANPYLANFAGTNASGSFINGEIIINKGHYDYGGEDVPYVTIPTYNFAHYYQVKLSEATLSPAYSFFVQVGTDGTMTFETDGRQQAPASIAARNAEERPVKMDVDITLSDNHSSDQTGIIISDRYSEAYEIGRDLEKLFGSAYNLSVYTLMADNTPLAFQALAIRSNMQVIPVGYRAPEQGEYTFRLNEATSSIDLLNEQYEQLVLVDYQTGELTNLLIADYTFYSERTQADNRFAIYAVPRQNAPTDLPNAIGQDKQAQKILHNGHLYILRDGNVYNGNGQIVK